MRAGTTSEPPDGGGGASALGPGSPHPGCKGRSRGLPSGGLTGHLVRVTLLPDSASGAHVPAAFWRNSFCFQTGTRAVCLGSPPQ